MLTLLESGDDGLKAIAKGEAVAENGTRYFNAEVAEVLGFINQFHTVHPGDVVSRGTACSAFVLVNDFFIIGSCCDV